MFKPGYIYFNDDMAHLHNIALCWGNGVESTADDPDAFLVTPSPDAIAQGAKPFYKKIELTPVFILTSEKPVSIDLKSHASGVSDVALLKMAKPIMSSDEASAFATATFNFLRAGGWDSRTLTVGQKQIFQVKKDNLMRFGFVRYPGGSENPDPQHIVKFVTANKYITCEDANVVDAGTRVTVWKIQYDPDTDSFMFMHPDGPSVYGWCHAKTGPGYVWFRSDKIEGLNDPFGVNQAITIERLKPTFVQIDIKKHGNNYVLIDKATGKFFSCEGTELILKNTFDESCTVSIEYGGSNASTAGWANVFSESTPKLYNCYLSRALYCYRPLEEL